MAFRAEEAAERGFVRAKNYLISRDFSPSERAAGEEALADIIEKCGPVVDTYPSWHPLVSQHDDRQPITTPSKECGYEGLDHTVYFAQGFITCPYHSAEKVLESTSRLKSRPRCSITADELDVPFYNDGVKPVLVRCEWDELLEGGYLVPKKWAVPLMMEKELPGWRWASVAETWETMRPYILGQPHGNRSSLFVSQDTALAMKKIFVAMTETGMYGPYIHRQPRLFY